MAALTVVCRGSWMPRTNKVFGCPPTKPNISPFLRTNSCRKFLTTFSFFSPLVKFFPKFYQDFSCYFRKLPPGNSDDHFFNISPNFCFFFLNIFPDAPLILDAQGCSSLFTHLPLLFRHLPMHFFRKLRRWMPPGRMPGTVAPPAPPSARHWALKRHVK